jgi:glutathione S-transferase
MVQTPKESILARRWSGNPRVILWTLSSTAQPSRRSPVTTKLRCYLTYAKIAFVHEQHLPGGMKPGTDYQKVPVIDVKGRQVNDSAIILKYLMPVLGLEFHQEWEDRLVLEVDTSLKMHASSSDWAKLAVNTIGAPSFLTFILGPYLRRLETNQGKFNIANSGLGHKEIQELDFAKDFKAAMKGNKFFLGNDAPGHVDLSFYGLMAGFLYADCDIANDLMEQADLVAWVDAMK